MGGVLAVVTDGLDKIGFLSAGFPLPQATHFASEDLLLTQHVSHDQEPGGGANWGRGFRGGRSVLIRGDWLAPLADTEKPTDWFVCVLSSVRSISAAAFSLCLSVC